MPPLHAVAFGRFFFRFPNGEAGTDVFDRMATFITYLCRTMGGGGYFKSHDGRPGERKPAQNYVLVTHGLLMRIFCMCAAWRGAVGVSVGKAGSVWWRAGWLGRWGLWRRIQGVV